MDMRDWDVTIVSQLFRQRGLSVVKHYKAIGKLPQICNVTTCVAREKNHNQAHSPN